MLRHPRLRRSFTVSVVEPALLFLMTEHTELTFQGEAYVALAPLLDGKRSLTEILTEASAKAALPSLFGALAHLEKKGCLVEADDSPDGPAEAFWDTLGAEPARAASTLTASPIALQALDDLPLEPLRHALAATGLGIDEAAALRLVAVRDYLSPQLEAFNRDALVTGRPWALVKPIGTVVWVGPIFRPKRGGSPAPRPDDANETGCWECLAQRLRVNRQVEHYLSRRMGRPTLHVARAWLPASVRLAANWAASELARSLVPGGAGALEGKVLTMDLVRRDLASHTLVKRPQCPACGRPEMGAPTAPAELVSRPRPRASFGRERVAAAAETYERYKHLVSPITGVVTSLVPREANQGPLEHNYVAAHYFPMTSDNLSALRINLLARSGGKGRSEAQARTSALCEAIERYSGIAWGDEPRTQASYTALGPGAVHIRELALFSEAQYAERGGGPAASELHEVPEPLPDEAEIAWTTVWSLTHARPRYLPTAYCFYGHRDPGRFFTRCDSNGSAAGNTREEAILYGFLELVERDSVALWWYNRVRRPSVDAESFGLPYWSEMKRYYDQELRRELHVLDLTADLGIPAFAVVSRRREREVEDVILGFAAHLDPSVALMRALEESNQYLPSVREEAEDGSTVYRLYSEETVRWWKSATFANQPYLVPDPEARPRRLADYHTLASDDVRTDVETCLAAARRCGLEVLALDQTRPDIGLPVVKVVAPGMRHFWRRLAPGRLYDVPVRLGWLPAPLREDELNPISCFV